VENFWAYLLLVLLLNPIGSAGGMDVLAAIPGAKYLFGLSASPAGRVVALYVAKEGDGEYILGRPTLVWLGERGVIKTQILPVPESLISSASPIWSADAKSVYFHADDGIYKVLLDSSIPRIRKIVSGITEGLVLSPDEKLLAYLDWDRGKGRAHNMTSLRAVDLNTGKRAREWTLPVRYEGDKGWFNVVFGPQNSLYAKTYDEEATSPLKRFDLSTGKIETLCSDFIDMVMTSKGLYFTPTKGKVRLLRISPDGGQETLTAPGRYNSLTLSADGHSMVGVVYETKTIYLIDVQTGSARMLAKGCEDAAVLADGTVVYSSGGKLLLNPDGCRN